MSDVLLICLDYIDINVIVDVNQLNLDIYAPNIDNAKLSNLLLSLTPSTQKVCKHDYIPNEPYNFKILRYRCDIPVSFWAQHIHKVDWHRLCEYGNYDEKFWLDNWSNIVWSKLCVNTNIPPGFYAKHHASIPAEAWSGIIANVNLPITFLRLNPQYRVDLDANVGILHQLIRECILSRLKETLNGILIGVN